MEGVNIVMILFSGGTEYSDRKVIILPRYSIPCLPLSNTVVVCYGRVHCRIQSWIPGSVLFRLTEKTRAQATHAHMQSRGRRASHARAGRSQAAGQTVRICPAADGDRRSEEEQLSLLSKSLRAIQESTTVES